MASRRACDLRRKGMLPLCLQTCQTNPSVRSSQCQRQIANGTCTSPRAAKLTSASLTRQAEPIFAWRLDLYSRSRYCIHIRSAQSAELLRKIVLDLTGILTTRLSSQGKWLYRSRCRQYSSTYLLLIFTIQTTLS
jgi:hypothetical protein